MADPSPRTLTIVIPALNEEEAIGETISRCLAARDEIRRVADLDDVEVIVVSDGSTDRTVEIARGFDEVEVIVFEKNRGYGAAIKEGFRRGRGELVGFLDADGTCDPRYFAEMCRVAVEDDAEIVLGSRMGAESKMPWVRKVGNRLYALLLGLLCGRGVSDTASGMRVIQRRALPLLYPLPDRLHFTPAMSARALTNGLQVLEIPMRYEERVGQSKLRVLADGLRFLRTIIEGVLCYRPERLFLMVFTLFALVGGLMAAYPVEYYWHHRRVEEWMIYRFVACFLLGSAGFLLLCAAVLSNRMSALGPKRRGGESFWVAMASHLFEGVPLAVFTGLTLLASVALVWPAAAEYVQTRQVTLHWSRIIVGAFGVLLVFQALVTAVLLQLVALWKYQIAEREAYAFEPGAAALPPTSVEARAAHGPGAN
jgi:glycosyltransferase involved in cell wall biosynthesis